VIQNNNSTNHRLRRHRRHVRYFDMVGAYRTDACVTSIQLYGTDNAHNILYYHEARHTLW